MADLNLDISQELNITVKRGDDVKFFLVFKDSDGVGIELDDQAAFYRLNMEVRESDSLDGELPYLKSRETDLQSLPIEGAPTTNGRVGLISIVNSSELGEVEFTIDSSVMKTIPAGIYVYDIEASKKVGSLTTKQTWVRGTFTVNEDVSITS